MFETFSLCQQTKGIVRYNARSPDREIWRKQKQPYQIRLLTLRMSSRGHWSRRYLCKSRHNTVQSQHSTGDIKDFLGSIVSTGPILQQSFLKHHCLRTNHMTLSNRKSLNRPLCHTTSKPSVHTGRLGEGQATIRSSSLTGMWKAFREHF